MGSVTIAATYGAGGSAVAPAVAERLGLHMVDRAIPVELAHRLARPLTEALADDERREGTLTRILTRAISMSGLFVGVPVAPEELGVDERITATEHALREAAAAAGVVVLGRAGVFVLAHRADTFHVRLDGPVDARVRQAMEHFGIDEATARQQQRESDMARRAYVRHFYPGRRWEDPSNYHLVLDSTAIPVESCAELVVTAARAYFAATPA
jgi:cytidylate kinase